MIKIKFIVATTLLSMAFNSQAATYAGWLTQIGDSDAVQSAANNGKGITIGVVDTGILANDKAFSNNQVNTTLSGCAGVSFSCGNASYNDVSGLGHGTAVAAIAAGSGTSNFNYTAGGYTTKIGNTLGLATGSGIVAERVFNTGYTNTSDVANGITQAAKAGVSVINLSVTAVNSPDVTAAINDAANKGVYIVWAGGNNSTSLFNSTNMSGLTSAAISHLVFVGSVNSTNKLSSFSQIAGTGSFVDNTNTKTAYSERWIMAGGENIMAPNINSGSNAYSFWSGTSMAAPLVSGSLALLEAAWPVLKTNGTATNLLLSTATKLGSATIYGNGLINLTAAFSPIGGLTIKQANGQSMPTTKLTSSVITGGALGSLNNVQNVLSTYTAFDSYSRNFTVNMINLVKVGNPTTPTAATSTSTIPTTATKKLAYTDTQGNTWAFSGNTNTALYSNNLAQSFDSLNSGISNLAQGGNALAIGTNLSEDRRMAISYSETENHYTTNVGLGFSQKVNDDLTTAIKFNMLNEQNSLLGSTLGNSKHDSYSFGVSAAYNVSEHNSFIVDTAYSMTNDNSNASGLIAGTSGIVSQSFGAAWVISGKDDKLTMSVQQPLKVTNGYASVMVASTNADGTPKYSTQQVSLTPNGRELVYGVNYSTGLTKDSTIAVKMAYHQDYNNISGVKNNEVGVAYKLSF